MLKMYHTESLFTGIITYNFLCQRGREQNLVCHITNKPLDSLGIILLRKQSKTSMIITLCLSISALLDGTNERVQKKVSNNLAGLWSSEGQ